MIRCREVQAVRWAILFALLFAVSPTMHAQATPITSLPRPAGDTDPPVTAASPAKPSTKPSLAQPSPGQRAQPITSLPAPPSTNASPKAEPLPAPAPPPVVPVTPVPAAAAPLPIVPAVVVQPEQEPPPVHVATLPAAPEPVRVKKRVRPFSTIAIQIKGGFGGVGLDIATPLAQRLNLRVGGSAFTYSGGYNVDGINFDGQVNFRSATVQLDWFPFNNGFRISPGVNVYNGNNLNATLSVPAGQSFDLGDGSYTSSATDPVHGTGSMTFGRRTAPMLTMGFGNMIPRSGRHFSVPFEVGVQYIGDPLISFNLAGTACTNLGCDNIATDPASQANLKQEINDINSQINLLRFYPVISLGAAWAF